MEWLIQNPLALWLVIGGVLLAIEVGTTTGWLLWPAGAATLTAIVTLILPLSLPLQMAVFAVLTIIATLAGRRFFPAALPDNEDINDTLSRLVGSEGIVAQSFKAGIGRVLVDGKEWAAELEEGGTLASGAKVIVTQVGGARLRVRAH